MVLPFHAMKTSTSHARRTPNQTPVAWEHPIEHFKFDAFSANAQCSQNGSQKMVPKWKPKKSLSQRASTDFPINLMRQSQRVEKISGGEGSEMVLPFHAMKTSTSHARRTPNQTPVAWEHPIEHFKFDACSANAQCSQNGSQKMVPKWKPKKRLSQRASTDFPINLMRQSQRVEKISGGRGLKWYYPSMP